MLNLPSLTWDNLGSVLETKPAEPYERLVDRVDRSRVEVMIEGRLVRSLTQLPKAPSRAVIFSCDINVAPITHKTGDASCQPQ